MFSDSEEGNTSCHNTVVGDLEEKGIQIEEKETETSSRLLIVLGFAHIPEKKRNALILILTIVFLDLFGVGLVYPMIPFYAEQLGASTAEIGAISSVYGILQLIGSFLVGKMSDKYGRKTVFLLSLMSACFSYFSLSIAPTILIFFIVRIPIGLFKQTVTIGTTIIADISPLEERARFIGFIGTAVGMGFIFGPTISAILAQYGMFYPVYLCTVLYILDMYLLYTYFPNSTADLSDIEEIPLNVPIERVAIEISDDLKDKKDDENYKAEVDKEIKKITIYSLCTDTSSFLKVVLSSAISYLLLVQFISSLAELTFNATFQQFAFARYDLTASENGYLMSYMSLLEVIVQGVIVGPLARLRSESELLTLSIILYSLSTFVLGMLETIPLVLVVLVPTLGSFRIFTTCLVSKISKSAPKSQLGYVFGISGSLSSVCRAISPYIGALIVQFFGSFAGTLLVSVFAFSLFLLLSFKPIA